MTSVKRYGQFCGLARALDEVGDRWTLLIVRELLLEPATYSGLRSRLPGVATNLLAERLSRLQATGLVVRDEDTRRYALTERGQALRPVLHELIRWGAPLMTSGPGEDAVNVQWMSLALEALLQDPNFKGAYTVVVLESGTTSVNVRVDERGRRVDAEARDETPDAVVTGSLPDLLAAAHAGTLVDGLEVAGSRLAAGQALSRA